MVKILRHEKDLFNKRAIIHTIIKGNRPSSALHATLNDFLLTYTELKMCFFDLGTVPRPFAYAPQTSLLCVKIGEIIASKFYTLGMEVVYD